MTEPEGAPRRGGRWHPLAGRRGAAYLLDAVGYLGVALATVPIGLAVQAAGPPSRTVVLALSAIPPVVATVWAARAESARGATWGKRRLGLRVVADDAAPLTFARGLVRNAVKIAVPWQVGHVLAVGAAFGRFDEMDPLTLGAGILTYPLLGAMIWAVAWGAGRGLHDRVARTRVVGEPAGGSSS